MVSFIPSLIPPPPMMLWAGKRFAGLNPFNEMNVAVVDSPTVYVTELLGYDA